MAHFVQAIVMKCKKGDEKPGRPWCISGDTKIPLLDGRTLTMREIVNEFKNRHFWVYSCCPNGQIVPGKAYAARLTRRQVKVIRVYLDNGKYIDCTPDHLIMLRNGTYIEAVKLKQGDSLMPLYIHGYDDLYLRVRNNKTGRYNYVHRLVMRSLGYLCKKDDIVCHKNFIRIDNRPENLIVMNKVEHHLFHSSLRKGVVFEQRGKTYKEIYGECAEFEREKIPVVGKKYFKEYNHKVVNIEALITPVDVYNFEVEKYNNYAVASGIFVHNCVYKPKKPGSQELMSPQPKGFPKAQPLYSKIKTPNGWVKMGDIKIGQEVCTPSGKTASVTGIFPQGVRPTYKIILEDGRSADCDKDHLWEIYSDEWNMWKILPLKKIIELQKSLDLYVPVVDSEIMYKLERKKATKNRTILKYKIKSIEYLGMQEVQCIMIDHPDHLYITDNNIVTHNTYKTQKDAKYGVKMMKTFGVNMQPNSWFLDVMLPSIYAEYVKNPGMIKNFPANISDSKIKTFLEVYKEEIATVLAWLPKFHKYKNKINELKLLQLKIASIDKPSSEIIDQIYNDLIRNISIKLLKKYYNQNVKKTAISNLLKAGIIDYSYDRSRKYPVPRDLDPFLGPFIKPGRGPMIGPRRRRFVSPRGRGILSPRERYYLCPECRLKLFRNIPLCPFCGRNPLNSIRKFKDNERNNRDVLEEIKKLKEYLGIEYD